MSGMRAPMTDAPAVGCGRDGPRRCELDGEAFELTSPNVLELRSRRPRGRGLVQKHRNAEALRDC
jgi:hypothetical protein